jgi:hypothetical protein
MNIRSLAEREHPADRVESKNCGAETDRAWLVMFPAFDFQKSFNWTFWIDWKSNNPLAREIRNTVHSGA